MQDQGTSFASLLILVVVAVLITVFRSSPKNRQKHRKQTPVWKPTQSSRLAGIRKPQKKTANGEQQKNIRKAKVKYIIDGDTIIVSRSWRKFKIRLDSIDCPENGQHWGDIAKFGLIKLIEGRNVRLEEHGLDYYGRTLATVYVQHSYGSEWINVNERMVTLGHSWVMRRFYDHLPKDRQAKLNRLERWAKSKKSVYGKHQTLYLHGNGEEEDETVW